MPAAPPPPKGALVAVRDRREEVIAQLTAEFARDTFDVDELERRLDLAHRAEDVASLDVLTVDLGVAGGAPATALAPRPAATTALDRWPKTRSLFAIFGGLEKSGAWTCPRKLRAVVMCGGGTLDFREAELAPGETELLIITLMGGFEVIVPPWLAVECDASAIMGGFDHVQRAPTNPDPDRPILRITGLAVMGGVSIETRLPGESSRDARRRAKREAKALRGQRAELPAATARRRDD